MPEALAALLASALSLGLERAQLDASEQQVRCAEIAFSRSAESRDRAAFRALLHPDARFIAAGVSRGPDEVMATWEPFFSPEGPAIRWRPELVEVSEAGDVALSRGPYRVVGTSPSGERTESWGTFMSIWRRNADGEWRVQFDSGADVGMTPSDAQRAVLESDDPRCSARGE